MQAAAEVDIRVPVGVLMDLILDFEAYPEFLPEVRSAKVLRRDADAWEVSLELQLLRPLRYTIRAVRAEDEEDGEQTLRWSLIEGRLRSNEGAWTLTPLEDGSGCRVRWEADVQVGVYLPGGLIKTLTDRRLPALLARFQQRAESYFGFTPGYAPQ